MTDTNAPRPVDLDALEQAYKAATPGQWSWIKETLTVDAELITDGGDSVLVALGYHGGNAAIYGKESDKAFIALAHNVMPALVSELRAARERIARLQRINGSYFRAFQHMNPTSDETPEETARLDALYGDAPALPDGGTDAH